MLRQRDQVAGEDMSAPMGSIQVHGVPVQMFKGQSTTLHRADHALTNLEVVQAYKALSGDPRNSYDFVKAKAVVLGEIQLRWFEMSGLEIPTRVSNNQKARIQEARMSDETSTATVDGAATTQTTGTPAKKKEAGGRLTARSILEKGILAKGGIMTDAEQDELIAEVKRQIPSSRAYRSHITYYLHYLVKTKQLPESVKAQKQPKAAKPVATEAADNGAPAAAAVPGNKLADAPAAAPSADAKAAAAQVAAKTAGARDARTAKAKATA
jgi:hypothetical protein